MSDHRVQRLLECFEQLMMMTAPVHSGVTWQPELRQRVYNLHQKALAIASAGGPEWTTERAIGNVAAAVGSQGVLHIAKKGGNEILSFTKDETEDLMVALDQALADRKEPPPRPEGDAPWPHPRWFHEALNRFSQAVAVNTGLSSRDFEIVLRPDFGFRLGFPPGATRVSTAAGPVVVRNSSGGMSERAIQQAIVHNQPVDFTHVDYEPLTLETK